MFAAAAAIATAPMLHAAQGTLRLRILHSGSRQPLPRVVVVPQGGGTPSGPSDDTGFTTVDFTYDRELPYKLSLDVKAPPGLDFVSPFDQRVPVPRCSGTECFETITLRRRDERASASDLREFARVALLRSTPIVTPFGAFAGPGLASKRRDALLAGIATSLGVDAGELRADVERWAAAAESGEDRALAALYRGEPEQASATLARLLSERPLDRYAESETLALLAQAEYLRGDYAAAVESWQRSAALAPGNGEALNGLGAGLFQQGDRAGATAAFRASSSAAALYNLGVLDTTEGNLGQARRFFSKAAAAAGEADPLRSAAEEQLALADGPSNAPSSALPPLWLRITARLAGTALVLLAFAMLLGLGQGERDTRHELARHRINVRQGRRPGGAALLRIFAPSLPRRIAAVLLMAVGAALAITLPPAASVDPLARTYPGTYSIRVLVEGFSDPAAVRVWTSRGGEGERTDDAWWVALTVAPRSERAATVFAAERTADGRGAAGSTVVELARDSRIEARIRIDERVRAASGTTTTAAGEPLAGVRVTLLGTNLGTLTSAKGEFWVPLLEETTSAALVQFEKPGFTPRLESFRAGTERASVTLRPASETR
jgi:Flp pilus assembly protein TadD